MSWANFAPIDHNSAGRKRGGVHRPRAIPGWPAPSGRSSPRCRGPTPSSANATDAWPAACGKSRAIVAVGNSVLTIIWHLLADPDARYQDLGADYYHTKVNTRRRERDLIRQLEHLTGKKVTLATSTPAA